MSWGEIYNTSWRGVALDTARTVKARPDFFGSQLNLLTSEQPNLVVNGTFDTDSGWNIENTWTIENGAANGNGANGSGEQLITDASISAGTYKIVFEVKNYVSGSVKLYFEGFVGTNVSANGVYTIYRTTTADRNVKFRGTDFYGSIDNVSVQLVRADLDQIEAKKCLADWIHTTALKDLNN